MTVDEFKKLDLTKVTFVDIREDEELVTVPSPKGAVHIPMSKILQAITAGELPKDKKVLTVCRSGGRCSLVNEYLVQNGYKADYIEGGLIALNAA